MKSWLFNLHSDAIKNALISRNRTKNMRRLVLNRKHSFDKLVTFLSSLSCFVRITRRKVLIITRQINNILELLFLQQKFRHDSNFSPSPGFCFRAKRNLDNFFVSMTAKEKFVSQKLYFGYLQFEKACFCHELYVVNENH